MTNPILHRQIQGRLADCGVRYTRGRRVVVDALFEANGPRSAAELRSDLKDTVPLSTLYRTLSTLEEAEVVIPHFASKSLARYELAEWLTGHHHHLVCLECGQVDDVDVPPEYESQVDDLVSEISSSVAFVASNHALEIEGRCARCA